MTTTTPRKPGSLLCALERAASAVRKGEYDRAFYHTSLALEIIERRQAHGYTVPGYARKTKSHAQT